MRLLADFNAADEDGTLVATVSDILDGAARVPNVGQAVVLDDQEGHTVEAIVTRVNAPTIELRLIWASWLEDLAVNRSISYDDAYQVA